RVLGGARRDGLVGRLRPARHGDDHGRARVHERFRMSTISRRKMITRGFAAAAGLSGLAAAGRIAGRYGLVPPGHAGIYRPGGTLTYAAQRLLTRRSMAREFNRSQISHPPFANETAPPSDRFKRLQADGFKDWRLSIEGLVARPLSLSVDDVKRLPVGR